MIVAMHWGHYSLINEAIDHPNLKEENIKKDIFQELSSEYN